MKNKNELLSAFLTDSMGEYQRSMGFLSTDGKTDAEKAADIKTAKQETVTNIDGWLKHVAGECKENPEMLSMIGDIKKDLPRYVDTMHVTLTLGAQEVLKRKEFTAQIEADYAKNPDSSIHPQDKEAVFQKAMQVAASESIYAKTAEKLDQEIKGGVEPSHLPKISEFFQSNGILLSDQKLVLKTSELEKKEIVKKLLQEASKGAGLEHKSKRITEKLASVLEGMSIDQLQGKKGEELKARLTKKLKKMKTISISSLNTTITHSSLDHISDSIQGKQSSTRNSLVMAANKTMSYVASKVFSKGKDKGGMSV